MPVTINGTTGAVTPATSFSGSSSGSVTVQAPAVAGTNTLTLPAVTDTITTNTATQTLTNKTLSSPTFTGTSSSNISTTGTVVMGSPFTMRNKIINGAMQIWQRGTSFSATGNTYTADRFNSGGQTSTVSQSSDVPTGFTYSMSIAATSATYGTFEQRIESFNCVDLVGQSVTVSFYAKATTGGASGLTIGLSYANSVDNFSATTSIGTSTTAALTSSWTRYTATFNSLPSGAANGLRFFVYNTAGGVSAITYLVTGVQLEIGTAATPFEYRNYQQELAMCQRYCYTVFGNSSYETQFGIFTQQGTNTAYWVQKNPVLMRTSPTVTFSGNFQWTQTGAQTSFTPTAGQPQAYSFLGIIGNTGALTTGSCGRVSIANGGSGSMIVSAEL